EDRDILVLEVLQRVAKAADRVRALVLRLEADALAVGDAEQGAKFARVLEAVGGEVRRLYEDDRDVLSVLRPGDFEAELVLALLDDLHRAIREAVGGGGTRHLVVRAER